ncbi:trifunctional MMPL family transporter/lysophospholipid acyltransferase/class I SAM-dependent methyltransferase [Chitinophaga cymbidii]|uniref:Glycerol acyltransferase n=1 Tax=Chitinophaga cymbidii TaxID=1096750 RepID=A0A512RLB6_9BACT|nr:trifunctional MMPL family transporter/lysophospholipid acyltransferase/class I SAM-dependent methyltransferase [Chitinophaga cymbidii]GEP96450.1 glycerol acyltransferase [Chitinophaga cymbidii]
MGTIFISVYNFFAKRKWLLWAFMLGSFVIAGLLASRIRLEEDITRILPQDKKIDRLQQFLQSAKFADKLVVMLSREDAEPDSLVAAAQHFTEGLAQPQLQQHIKSIQAQADDAMMMNLLQAVQDHLPVFLEGKDYASIDSLITPARVKQTMESNYNTLISPAGLVLKRMIQADPVGISWIAMKKLQQLQVDEQFELYDGYVMSKDQRNLLLFITPLHPPNETGKNKRFLADLDAWVDTVQSQHKGSDISYFGATAVAVGNAMQLRQDTYFTQGITVLLLIVLIALFFRKKRAPLLVMLPVVFGALFSLAIVYLFKGGISVIALGAGCVVLGIAVNYSLHVFNHYRHLPDIRQVIKDLAMPMTVGSFTTVGGFLCLQFVKSPMLRDVGLFAAFSLVGAALFSLIVLPHLIVLGKRPAAALHRANSWLDKLSNWRPERNKYLVGGILLLTAVFFFTARNVTFESDMMRMNYMSDRLQKAEQKLNNINAYTAQSVYLISEGNNLNAALQSRERTAPVIQSLVDKGAIKKVSGAGSLLLSEEEQAARIRRWNAYWTPEKQEQLIRVLQQEGAVYKFRSTAFAPFETLLHKDYTALPPERSALLEAGLLSDFVTIKEGASAVISLLKVAPDRKDEVYAALDSQPQTVIFDKQYTANRLAEIIRDEFSTIAWMTSLLVFAALLLSYGRIELALITFIPMLFSWVWILGIMGLFGIPFNIVNIILSTFIFGLGDDYSIFTMDGLQQEYKTGSKHLPSFKSSIFFSAITTILGLGVLIFAKHPSLRSIALIAVIGISCVVLTSQVLIPFFFNWLITNRVKKKYAPWTLFGWTTSVFAFSYFTFGAFLLTFLGFFLVKINPFNLEKGKRIYHKILSKFTWSILHVMVNTKKTTINNTGEDFKKPAVVISNHQSFLDILMSTAMHPNVVLLTNQWVYNSPVFGSVVKMADYYPVAEGVEGSIEKLRERVEQGYSIVIYPEGTRSPDAGIKRFHKGAFYLAEELGLDILPAVIHGTAYTMSKGDFLLKNGTMTLKFLPRIKPDDKRWGDNYSARTKLVSRYFRQEYEALRRDEETPAYFREQLIYNYIYKGPVLEWYMRIKTKMENNYELFHQLLPKKGKIMDIGCGYGFMSYMLHFLAPERQIKGVDYDEEKIATAQHCYLRNEMIQFEAADITQYTLGHQDAFVLLDVLHYLPAAAQEQLLQQCIRKLNPGGVIIVRDGDADLGRRHEGTKLTELFSTRLLGFNKTANGPLSFFSSSALRGIAERNGATVEQIDNTRYTSNVIFIIKHSLSEQYA